MVLTLKRELGTFSLIFIAVITVIGSGILVIPATASSLAGPASILAVVVAGISMIIFILLYAEIGSELPLSGGTVRYPDISHGKAMSSMVGFGLLLAYIVSPPLVLEVMLSYMSAYIPGIYANGALTLFGILIASIIFIIFFIPNLVGVKITGILSNILGVIKVAIISFFVIAILLFTMHFSNFTRYGFLPYGFGGVGLAVGAGGLFFAFTGFRLIVDYAGEAKFPKKSMVRSLIISVSIVFIIYVLMQIGFIGSINWSHLASVGVVTGNWASISSLSSPLSQIALSNNLPWLSVIILFFAIYSPLVFVVPVLGAEARLVMGLADNGYLPKKLSELHKRFRTPYIAIIIILVLSIASLFLLPKYTSILSVVSSAYGYTYATVGVQYIVIRNKLPSNRFKVPFGTLLAPVSMFLGSLIVFWSFYPYTLYGFIIMIIVLPIYFYYTRRDLPFIKADFKNGGWFLVYAALLVLISYTGPTEYGGVGLINSNLTYLLLLIISLVFYYVGYKSGRKEIDLKQLAVTES